VIIKIVEIIAIPVLAFLVGIFFLGLSRRIMARIHWRYGPPITQPIIDIIRFSYQESVSHGVIFDLGIIFSLAASIAVVLFIPLGGMCALSSSGGLLVILYLMLLIPLGVALSSGEGANPNISIGISRKLILSLGYEVPLILILLTLMTRYGTISIADIVSQQGSGWTIFSVPLFMSGIAYFLILPAILEIRPFDMASAPQEISSGHKVEYGGKYLAIITIEHAFTLFIGLALFVDLFLGGASNPLFFFIKMLVVFILCIFINAVFPRFRIDQAIRYLWKWPTALALAGLIATSVMW